MKFKQFLTETTLEDHKDRRINLPANISKAVEFARTHCSANLDMITKNAVPFRGGQSNVKFMEIDYSLGTRVSTNTGNMYTLLFDTNPRNAKWPKRSKSIICANEVSRAFGYSRTGDEGVFALIPFNGVNIACVNSEDIWDTKMPKPPFDTFGGTGYELPDYGQTVSRGVSDFAGLDNGHFIGPRGLRNMYTTSLESFTKAVTAAVENIKRLETDTDLVEKMHNAAGPILPQSIHEWMIDIVKNSSSTKDAVNKIIDGFHHPVTAGLLGFSLFSGSQFASKFEGFAEKSWAEPRYELWISGKCLAIRYDMWAPFRKKFMAPTKDTEKKDDE
jgi:hypothetical protein